MVTNKMEVRIMLVDDAPETLSLLTNMLQENGFHVLAFPSGELALKAIKKSPPDLLLLDVSMPSMDGFQVCDAIKADKTLPEFPVIFLSGLTNQEEKARAFEAGGVDFVTKPVHLEELMARITNHLCLGELQFKLQMQNSSLEKLVVAQVGEIQHSQMSTIFALAKLAEARDPDMNGHLERVQDYCRLLAVGLGTSKYQNYINDTFVDTIYYASPLHDIGKITIADRILLKPGKLTSKEMVVMQTHAEAGAEALAEVYQKYPQNYFIKMGIDIAAAHHERWDGQGYPKGLSEEQIPLVARIMKVADVYDALRSSRCYKQPFDHAASLQIIAEGQGKEFDPIIADVFFKIAGRFDEIYTQVH
jgi:putative two-component system response regulator